MFNGDKMMPNNGIVPYGARVRLLYNFTDKNEIAEAIRDGKLKGFSLSNDMGTKTFIPKGEEGTVAEGPYSSGIFDYDKEIPVQFDMFRRDGGVKGYSEDFTIGVPREILEIVENKNKAGKITR